MLDSQYLIYFGLIVAFSSFAQGFMGLGFGIIAIAGVTFIPWDLERASVAINLLLVVLNCTIIWAGRRDFRINWRLVGLVLSGELIGVPLGYLFILKFGNQPVFRVALGLVLIGFAANELFRPKIRKGLPASVGFGAGVLGGFLAGGFTAAGPPLALFIYSRHDKPEEAKGTLQVLFMAATIWRLFNIIAYGKGVSTQIMEIAALALPLVVVFAVVGHWFTRRVPSNLFVKIVYTFIGLAGVMNIVRAAM